MYWFTSDEHYHHTRILTYCKRPFACMEEMDEALISNHNALVGKNDITIHAGDFAFAKKEEVQRIIKRLNGNHIFLKGSHDRWLGDSGKFMWRDTIEGQFIVVCHYAMRTWERAHYNSWQLYGHSHGTLKPIGKQMDIGVDTNNFKPYSFAQIKEILDNQPNFMDLRYAKNTPSY